MNILIIEDEFLLAKSLEKKLLSLLPDSRVVAICASVMEGVSLLREQAQELDLIFADIQLEDGLSFEIFQQLTIYIPTIFTTAFDQYAIEAFKANGIDYLLKPISSNELEAALMKLKRLRSKEVETQASITPELLKALLSPKSYKSRFSVHIGRKIDAVMSSDIDLFVSEDSTTYLWTSGGKRYPTEDSLDRLIEVLDPQHFFRISRKYIVHLSAIDHVLAWSNSRLKIVMKHAHVKDMLIVSRDRTPHFREWFAGE